MSQQLKTAIFILLRAILNTREILNSILAALVFKFELDTKEQRKTKRLKENHIYKQVC